MIESDSSASVVNVGGEGSIVVASSLQWWCPAIPRTFPPTHHTRSNLQGTREYSHGGLLTAHLIWMRNVFSEVLKLFKDPSPHPPPHLLPVTEQQVKWHQRHQDYNKASE